MIFFSHHRLQYILMTFFRHCVLRNYTSASLPLSWSFFELERTSGKMQVAERRSGIIRGGGVALGALCLTLITGYDSVS